MQSHSVKKTVKLQKYRYTCHLYSLIWLKCDMCYIILLWITFRENNINDQCGNYRNSELVLWREIMKQAVFLGFSMQRYLQLQLDIHESILFRPTTVLVTKLYSESHTYISSPQFSDQWAKFVKGFEVAHEILSHKSLDICICRKTVSHMQLVLNTVNLFMCLSTEFFPRCARTYTQHS